jgi:hypothetical protein
MSPTKNAQKSAIIDVQWKFDCEKASSKGWYFPIVLMLGTTWLSSGPWNVTAVMGPAHIDPPMSSADSLSSHLLRDVEVQDDLEWAKLLTPFILPCSRLHRGHATWLRSATEVPACSCYCSLSCLYEYTALEDNFPPSQILSDFFRLDNLAHSIRMLFMLAGTLAETVLSAAFSQFYLKLVGGPSQTQNSATSIRNM